MFRFAAGEADDVAFFGRPDVAITDVQYEGKSLYYRVGDSWIPSSRADPRAIFTFWSSAIGHNCKISDEVLPRDTIPDHGVSDTIEMNVEAEVPLTFSRLSASNFEKKDSVPPPSRVGTRDVPTRQLPVQQTETRSIACPLEGFSINLAQFRWDRGHEMF